MQRDRAVQLVKDLNIEDYVASLTLQESLKFLVAIGCEKLKNDYVAIVSFHNIMHRVEIEKIWRYFIIYKSFIFDKEYEESTIVEGICKIMYTTTKVA